MKDREPLDDVTLFQERRARLSKKMPKDSVLILVSSPHLIRNHDVHHYYRQDSNFYYLTGFEEAESVFVFRPGRIPESVLFVQKKDALKETWEGFLYGPEGAKKHFSVDECFENSEFEQKTCELLEGSSQLYYRLFFNSQMDASIQNILRRLYAKKSRLNQGLLPIFDSYPLLGEQRLIKTEAEIKLMRTAAEITAKAHLQLMQVVRPGMTERQLYGHFLQQIMQEGCAREGYQGIFAGGAGATTLHYTFNDQTLLDGDLVLVDAGGEYHYYSADITRTFPINRKFSPAQKRIYQKVLDVQKDIIQMVKPGLPLRQLQSAAVEMLTGIMIDEGLLRGSVGDRIADASYRKYYPHGIGHWLGLDVHDAGQTEVQGESRKLEAGMVLTVEPGLYIPPQDSEAPSELRGLGIRIEDDILVQNSGPEILTSLAPKEIDEIEGLGS